MILSTKDIMIAGGCSFSSNWIKTTNRKKPRKWKFDLYTGSHKTIPWEYIEPFKVWSEVVSTELNYKLINVSKAGYGNDAIFHKVIDQIFKHKNSVKLVVVMWSNWLRKDIQTDHDQWQSTTFIADMERYRMDYFSSMYALGGFNGFACVDYFYRYSLTLSQICNSFGIKLVQCQGTNVIKEPQTYAEYEYLDKQGTLEHGKSSPYRQEWTRREVVKYFIDHYGFDILEKGNTFIDWPLFHEIGGQTLTDIMRPNKHKFWISMNDSHPNGAAHKMYAQKILDKINE